MSKTDKPLTARQQETLDRIVKYGGWVTERLYEEVYIGKRYLPTGVPLSETKVHRAAFAVLVERGYLVYRETIGGSYRVYEVVPPAAPSGAGEAGER